MRGLVLALRSNHMKLWLPSQSTKFIYQHWFLIYLITSNDRIKSKSTKDRVANTIISFLCFIVSRPTRLKYESKYCWMNHQLNSWCLFWPAGTDIAGEVVGLGPGVTSFAIGDKISSWTDIRVCALFWLLHYVTYPTLLAIHNRDKTSEHTWKHLSFALLKGLQSFPPYVFLRDDKIYLLTQHTSGRELVVLHTTLSLLSKSSSVCLEVVWKFERRKFCIGSLRSNSFWYAKNVLKWVVLNEPK